MSKGGSRQFSVEGSPLHVQLVIIQALVFVLPALVLAYLYYSQLIRFESSQLFLIGAIMVLAFGGLIILRQVFDRILNLNNMIRSAASENSLYAEIHKDTSELHEITQGFNGLMKHFEAANKDLQRRVFELFSIRELMEMASKSLNFRELLALLLEKAMSVSSAANGGIYLVDPADKKLRRVASKGDALPMSINGAWSAEMQYLLMRVMREKKPLHETVKDSAAPPPGNELTVLFMPIFIREQIVAVMYLYPWQAVSTGGGDNEQILSIMIGEIGFALENAMLHTRLERHSDQLQKRTNELSKTNHALKKARLKLQNVNEGLEERVLERTAKLAEANEELQKEIVQRKSIQEKLETAKEGAESANIAKSRFLANMSHELRTPLNAIIGFSDIMTSRPRNALSEENQEKYLKNILSSGHQLLSLLDAVLDMSRIESGITQLKVSRFDPAEVIREAAGMVTPTVEKKRQWMEIDIDESLPFMVADREKIKRVLYHLLSNAAKFTPDGGRVAVTAQRAENPTGSDPSIDKICFHVSDSGIGLNMDDWDRITRPFEQGDNSATRKFDGAGIGLALVKKMVELHGGVITAESPGDNQGCTVTIVLPVEVSQQPLPRHQ